MTDELGSGAGPTGGIRAGQPLVAEFDSEFARLLPETHAVLQEANLTLHLAVCRAVLHGSRGLLGGGRSTSDLDLSLVVDVDPGRGGLGAELSAIAEVTIGGWRSEVDLDLAVVWDKRRCGLSCFDVREWTPGVCRRWRAGCFGVYKPRGGMRGIVPEEAVDVRRMYPCLVIWRRGPAGRG
jgi:hypothetical protein